MAAPHKFNLTGTLHPYSAFPVPGTEYVLTLSRNHFITLSLRSLHFLTVHCPLSTIVIQITVSTNSPIFGVQSHETNQHDRFFICSVKVLFSPNPVQNRRQADLISRFGRTSRMKTYTISCKVSAPQQSSTTSHGDEVRLGRNDW